MKKLNEHIIFLNLKRKGMHCYTQVKYLDWSVFDRSKSEAGAFTYLFI